jgi:hypothetical protein
VFIVRCIATVRPRTKENTAPILLSAGVLLALPSNGSMRHSILQMLVSNENEMSLRLTTFCKWQPENLDRFHLRVEWSIFTEFDRDIAIRVQFRSFIDECKKLIQFLLTAIFQRL